MHRTHTHILEMIVCTLEMHSKGILSTQYTHDICTRSLGVCFRVLCERLSTKKQYTTTISLLAIITDSSECGMEAEQQQQNAQTQKNHRI